MLYFNYSMKMAKNVLELSKTPFKTQRSPNTADTVSAGLLQQA